MPSDIQITVRFNEQCVFAGEEVKCTITFRNVPNVSEPPTPGPHQRRQSRTLSIEKLVATSPRFSDVIQSPRVGKANYPPSAMRNPIGGGGNGSGALPGQRPGHKHQRSVSIISIGSPTISKSQDEGSIGQPGRPVGGHRRPSTIQVHTGHDRQASQNRDLSALQIPTPSGRRSPLSSTSASTPVYESRRSTPDFQFPPQSTQQTGSKAASRDPSREPGPKNASSAVPTRLRREPSVGSRVASERSSGEFYSLSNHSGETFMSEQPSIMSDRPQIQIPSAMMRRHYRMDSGPITPRRPQPQPVNLMMGYAHLSATFTVDGSLVDQSAFDEVKQKGFLGGQAGGGVVGVAQKKPRPTSGFLSGFNFSSIGESLNSLVGGDSMSSVREMNAVTNSRAIPLLSAPQSLLFVNLHLEPGDERSYSFICPLPRGLPSSYRGKAIKINYNLLIGVQSAPTSSSAATPNHRVRQISIPIRVFSGVDADGEILGHDLMQPHVLLRDPARTASISGTLPSTSTSTSPDPSPSPTKKYTSPTALQTYITTLLTRPGRRHSSTTSLYDPTPHLTPAELKHPTLSLINRAILTSTQRGGGATGGPSQTRFNITHAHHPIALLTLSRPLLKLGETLHLSINLADPSTTAIQTCSVHCTLETTETVSQSLAVRSAASISRVSRKVYASWVAGGGAGCVLNGKRLAWEVKVPSREGVSPGFETSGVGLSWGVRVEFGVLRVVGAVRGEGESQGKEEGVEEARAVNDDEDEDQDDDVAVVSSDDDDDDNQTRQARQLRTLQQRSRKQDQQNLPRSQNTAQRKKPLATAAATATTTTTTTVTRTATPLLEPISTDERGIVSIAVEKLDCESFEVVIPITVYGDVLPLFAAGRDEVRVVGL